MGFLGLQSLNTMAHELAVLRDGLSEAGWTEGKNLLVEFRWAEGRYDRLPGMAAELVDLNIALLIAQANAAALAAKKAAGEIPIVFSIGGDPIRLGLALVWIGHKETQQASLFLVIFSSANR